MGEIIARKVRGMNWKAKISLVLIFTLVFSTFMYQGWYRPKPVAADITAATFPGTGASVTGTGTIAWTTPGNIAADDTAYATAALSASATSRYLQGTNYGFAIPSGATINGIEVGIMRMSSSNGGGNSINDTVVSLIKGGTITGSNYAVVTDWPITMAAAGYGGASDLWGTTWTPADINATNFGVALAAVNQSSGGSRTASVDYITITVTYTVGDQVNVADGTNPSNATVYASDTNKAIDGFTMATNTNTATVTGVTVAVTNSSNLANIRLYRDSGNGTYDGTETQIGSTVTSPGATVSFTGLSESLNTTATNYLIVGDIASGATAGQTVTAVVSGATVTAPDTAGTITDSSAMLTIGSNVCARANPTVSITPLNAAVSAGSSAAYTVSVTNNDNQFCATTTFTISKTDAPVVPNANFGASTLGSSSTGALAYGQTWTTTLRHQTTSGASLGQTEQTYVTSAADANHAAVQSNTVTTMIVRNPLLHNSLTMTANGSPKNYWSAIGGWGIAGGVYGEFACETCHTKTTTNIKRVKTAITVPDTSKGNIPGSAVNLQSAAGTTNGFGDDQTTHATSTRICEVCHTQVAKHKYNQAATPLHENTATTPPNYQDCIACHEHKKGFALPGCIDCHSKQQGNRAPVVGQFSNNSHHIQGADLTNTQCYQCHWEANANGSINYTYHLGWKNGLAATSGAAVDLVVWGTSTTRPTTYTLNTTAVTFRENQGRTDMANINTHCLGCHNDTNLNTQPFGDGKKTSQYAWDGSSVAARYSQTGATTWGKYTTTTNAAQKNIAKAYSAHGNASANKRYWDITNGVDGNMSTSDTSGNVNVLCFDCHNSHGSSVGGTTTSYTSATTNGAIIKDTTAGLGAYATTYKPQASDGTGSRVACSAGASLCFDCHMTASAGTTPWGYAGTYGATQAIIGYFETPGWQGTGNANPSGNQQRFTYKKNKNATTNIAGSHFGASSSLSTTPMHTINGLCTPCHDPHGVTSNTAKIAAADKQYGVPLLKGTWVTSPYKEDAAPLAANLTTGASSETKSQAFRTPYNGRSDPGYHIDQNTFGTITGTNWQWGTEYTATGITQTAAQFGGLCLQCHAQANINPSSTATAWQGMDRIHNTVAGWGGSGANAGNAIHKFTCSKCHTPHSSALPRLMVMNCLNYNHRGRVASGGAAGQFTTYGYSTPNQNPGRDGGGAGQFPSGGGGGGNNPSNNGPYYFGLGNWTCGGSCQNIDPRPLELVQCHNVTNAGGTTFPSSQLWNAKTPW